MVSTNSFILCFIFVLFSSGVYCTCAGIYPPYVPLPTTTFNYEDMSTCCWFSKNTCCGVRDDIFDLSSIEDQINDIAARGLSDQCYIKLSNLFCFWCDPNTAEFVSTPNGGINPTSTLYLCPSFCDELFFKCFNDLDKIVNDFTELHTAKQFCEDFILDNFYYDDDDIFPNFRIVVGDVDGRNCMMGIDDDEIEVEAGICLPLPSSELVSSGHEFDPFVFAPFDDATTITVMLSVSLTLLFLLI